MTTAVVLSVIERSGCYGLDIVNLAVELPADLDLAVAGDGE